MKNRLKKLIRELLKEKKGIGETEYSRKRREFGDLLMKGYEPPGGELVNFLEGLTPDGYDKLGRKVSFVERGSIFGSGARPGKLSDSGDIKKTISR